MANGGISIDLSGLEEEIKRIASERLRAAAQKIADELTDTARQAITDFYGSYTPIEYKRQGGLNSSYTRFYSNAHGNIFYGGVQLHAGSGSYRGWSNGQWVGIDAEWPTSLALMGHHGYVEAFPHVIKNAPPVMSPTPYEILMKKREDIISNLNSYVN